MAQCEESVGRKRKRVRGRRSDQQLPPEWRPPAGDFVTFWPPGIKRTKALIGREGTEGGTGKFPAESRVEMRGPLAAAHFPQTPNYRPRQCPEAYSWSPPYLANRRTSTGSVWGMLRRRQSPRKTQKPIVPWGTTWGAIPEILLSPNIRPIYFSF